MPTDSLTTHLSAATDSIVAENVMPWDTVVCREADAPTETSAHLASARGPVAYTTGMEPSPRNVLPGYDSGVMIIVISCFLLLSLNFRHYSTFLKTFVRDLWDTRRRLHDNAGTTVSETRIMLSMIALMCVTEGVLIFSAMNASGAMPLPVLPGLLCCIAGAGAYYVFDVTVYSVVGYAFTDNEGRSQWLKGFNASQSLLALTLTLPALIALFNPDSSLTMCHIGIVLYIIARVIFIAKGFRVFYDNFYSLIYFILYLCTLEIAPLFLMAKITCGLT